jgi:hypothetical protein
VFAKPPAEFTWQNGAEFFYAMTRAMHELLIDNARRKNAEKRGGGKVGSLDELHERGSDVPEDGPPRTRTGFKRPRIGLSRGKRLSRCFGWNNLGLPKLFI